MLKIKCCIFWFRFVCICVPLFYQYLAMHCIWTNTSNGSICLIINFSERIERENTHSHIHTTYSPSHLHSHSHSHATRHTNSHTKQTNMCILIVVNVRKICDLLNFSIDSFALANLFSVFNILYYYSIKSRSPHCLCRSCVPHVTHLHISVWVVVLFFLLNRLR